MVEDREGDIYECFAFKPAGVEKLVRAAQDRCLADGGTLFAKAGAWGEAGRMSVNLPATPGRKARQAELSVSQGPDGPLEKLVTAILIAAVKVIQLVAERDGKTRRPLTEVFDLDDQPALERVCQSLEGKTQRQKTPHPNGSLAYAAWVFARLGGWTGYYGKPGPVVMLRGLTEFHAIKHGWTPRDV